MDFDDISWVHSRLDVGIACNFWSNWDHNWIQDVEQMV